MSQAAEWLDGHWVDLASVVGGVLYVLLCRRRVSHGHKFLTRNTGLNFFTGLAFAPLVVMFLAAFSSTIMQKLLESSRITLAGASVVALFALLEESPGA